MKEASTLRAGSQGEMSDCERQRAVAIAANGAMTATLGLSNYWTLTPRPLRRE